MIKVTKKEKNLYELTDGQNVLGSIVYTQTLTIAPIGYFGNAQIKIEGNIYEIKHIYKFPWNHSLSLINNSNEKISGLDFYQRPHSNSLSLEGISIKLNGIDYNFSAKSKLFRILTPMSSSYNWYDSNKDEVMSLVTTKGFPSTIEVSVETKLNPKDLNTAILALWGFYLLPKTKTSFVSILVIVILCPLLLYILYKAFSPYF